MRHSFPQLSKPFGIIRTVQLCICLSSLAQAQSVDTSLTPENTNSLILQTNLATQDVYRAFESNGPTIGDQIDLRYPAAFEINNISAPAGWAFQNITVDDSEKVATYFYQGIDPGNAAEFYDFTTPLTLDFQLKSLSGTSVTDIDITLQAQLTVFLDQEQQFATAFVQDTLNAKVASSALLTFRENSGLPADGSQDTQDSSGNGIPNLLYYAFGFGDPSQEQIDHTRLSRTTENSGAARFSYVRHKDQANDGLQYIVQCSTNLVTWTPVADLPANEQATNEVATSLDTTYERVGLNFDILGVRRFYRLAVSSD